jgi:hypothetical protein
MTNDTPWYKALWKALVTDLFTPDKNELMEREFRHHYNVTAVPVPGLIQTSSLFVSKETPGGRRKIGEVDFPLFGRPHYEILQHDKAAEHIAVQYGAEISPSRKYAFQQFSRALGKNYRTESPDYLKMRVYRTSDGVEIGYADQGVFRKALTYHPEINDPRVEKAAERSGLTIKGRPQREYALALLGVIFTYFLLSSFGINF